MMTDITYQHNNDAKPTYDPVYGVGVSDRVIFGFVQDQCGSVLGSLVTTLILTQSGRCDTM